MKKMMKTNEQGVPVYAKTHAMRHKKNILHVSTGQSCGYLSHATGPQAT